MAVDLIIAILITDRLNKATGMGMESFILFLILACPVLTSLAVGHFLQRKEYVYTAGSLISMSFILIALSLMTYLG